MILGNRLVIKELSRDKSYEINTTLVVDARVVVLIANEIIMRLL